MQRDGPALQITLRRVRLGPLRSLAEAKDHEVAVVRV